MSYTTLYYITPSGRIYEAAEFRNSHLGASLVWSNVFTRYLPDRIKFIKDTMGFEPKNPVTKDDYDALWKLWERPDVPIYVRSVLFSTFDYAYLEKQYFQRFYDDVLRYAGLFAAGSLIEQVQAIMKLDKKKILGVCWQQTSVSNNVWGKNISTSTQVWNIYEEIDSIENVKLIE
jgi:hypothetical protein